MRIVLATLFVMLASGVSALDPEFDLMKIDASRFVRDPSNRIYNGRVIRDSTIDGEYGRFQVLTAAERNKPKILFLQFYRNKDSDTGMVSFLHEVIDFYYAKAFAMSTSAAFVTGGLTTSYTFYFLDDDSIVLYTSVNELTGLHSFAVVWGETLRTVDSLAGAIGHIRREQAVNVIDHAHLSNDTLYFKDSVPQAEESIFRMKDFRPSPLGNGKDYFFFSKVLRIKQDSEGRHDYGLRVVLSDPKLATDPFVNSIKFNLGGAQDISVYEILNSADGTYTCLNDLPLVSISSVIFLEENQFRDKISSIELVVLPD